jgi:hypothetical protein
MANFRLIKHSTAKIQLQANLNLYQGRRGPRPDEVWDQTPHISAPIISPEISPLEDLFCSSFYQKLRYFPFLKIKAPEAPGGHSASALPRTQY